MSMLIISWKIDLAMMFGDDHYDLDDRDTGDAMSPIITIVMLMIWIINATVKRV